MTARLRRAGANWRLLVHEYVGGPVPYGDPYEVDGTGEPMRPGPRRWNSRSVRINDAGQYAHSLHFPRTEFDELVVGRGFLHIEQQRTGCWSVHVGGAVVHAAADREGRPLSVAVYGPGDYADPVPGCSYDLTWTDLPAGETTP